MKGCDTAYQKASLKFTAIFHVKLAKVPTSSTAENKWFNSQNYIHNFLRYVTQLITAKMQPLFVVWDVYYSLISKFRMGS